MKHLFRIAFHAIGFPIYYLCILATMGFVFIVMLIWDYHLIKKDDFKFNPFDELPDGTYCYHILDDGSFDSYYDESGKSKIYKHIYYQTFKDALLGRKTVKEFTKEIKVIER